MKKIILSLLIFLCAPAHAEMPAIWQGDIDHFQDNDLGRWQSGHWVHQFHEHHMAWWWVIDDEWYQYSAATYPYPDPFTPAGVTIETPTHAETHYRYYCSRPVGYYPYVNRCGHVWRRSASTTIAVPAAPPATHAAAVTQESPAKAPEKSHRRIELKHAPVAPPKKIVAAPVVAKPKPPQEPATPAAPPVNLIPYDNTSEENPSRSLQNPQPAQ